MFVCATTDCFADLPKDEVLPTLVDLEFTAVELPVREEGPAWYRPSQVAESLERALEAFRDTHRLTIAALTVEPAGPKDTYYAQFTACGSIDPAGGFPRNTRTCPAPRRSAMSIHFFPNAISFVRSSGVFCDIFTGEPTL